jgi:TonB family protein
MNAANKTFLAIATALMLFSDIMYGREQNVSDIVSVASSNSAAYPPIAIAAHVEGEVKVRVSVNDKGNVIKAEILEGHPLLRSPSHYAANRWQFSSGTNNRSVVLTFAFKLMPRCTESIDLTPTYFPPYKIEIKAAKPPIHCDDCSPEEQERRRCQNP